MSTQNVSTGDAEEPVPARPVGLDRGQLDLQYSLAYEELRHLASRVKRGDPGLTLSPTALVNEAWIKLAKSPGLQVESPLHFKRIAARAMRQLLVEAARRRNARKRCDSATFITFDESLIATPGVQIDVLALNSALLELARVAPRQADIVESRFFGGLEFDNIASLLGISESTLMRDWRAARAWLSARLGD